MILILSFIFFFKFGDVVAGVMANPFYVKIGFSNSKSEARKLIRGHGVKLNQSVVKDELYELLLEDVSDNKAMISVGKKKHFIVEVAQ